MLVGCWILAETTRALCRPRLLVCRTRNSCPIATSIYSRRYSYQATDCCVQCARSPASAMDSHHPCDHLYVFSKLPVPTCTHIPFVLNCYLCAIECLRCRWTLHSRIRSRFPCCTPCSSCPPVHSIVVEQPLRVRLYTFTHAKLIHVSFRSFWMYAHV